MLLRNRGDMYWTFLLAFFLVPVCYDAGWNKASRLRVIEETFLLLFPPDFYLG